ncbi:MAG: septum formation initiator family protein [Candidatus Omnitrophica bacterium]|nr:septum formation initiator family protein [Candidatus Omnitrophota bacterium]
MAKKDLTKTFIIIVIILLIFLPPFAKYQRLRYKNKNLEDRIRALQEESKRLEEEKRKLERDITYIEKKAREKIGVVRKGEIVLKETAEGQVKR